jgi:hypothetical protein
MILKIKIFLFIHILKYVYGFGSISSKLIYAQSAHETGNFTSKVFEENNNLFGMRQAKVRKNFATGTNRGHATYKNLYDSVRDYFERQKNFRISSGNDAAFVDSTVSSNYAEDRKYKEKWLAMNTSVKLPFSSGLLVLLFFFLLVGLFLLRVQSLSSPKKSTIKKIKNA